MILSVTKMILIYLNYRLWSVKLKVIYENVLDTLVFVGDGKTPYLKSKGLVLRLELCVFLDRHHNVFDMYRLLLFLWMCEFVLKYLDIFVAKNIGITIHTRKGAIMIHDCIYQFLRIFYHSRFKPQQLEMTATQLIAPVLDLVLTLPAVLRLFQEFSLFSNATKMRVQSKPEINE